MTKPRYSGSATIEGDKSTITLSFGRRVTKSLLNEWVAILVDVDSVIDVELKGDNIILTVSKRLNTGRKLETFVNDVVAPALDAKLKTASV